MSRAGVVIVSAVLSITALSSCQSEPPASTGEHARAVSGAFYYKITDLGTLGGPDSKAFGIGPGNEVVGKADQTVPVKQSRAMADRLKAAKATYRYVEQPLADHHFTREADRLQFLQELEAFLAKYNPAG